jgi:hypothetical protein
VGIDIQTCAACGGTVRIIARIEDPHVIEKIIGPHKTELIHHRGAWKGLEGIEYARLAWGDWFNDRRLLEPIGSVPPAQLEMA